MTAPTCTHCLDTGSLSGDADMLDCHYCVAAQERKEFESWAYQRRRNTFHEVDFLWSVYQNGKAAVKVADQEPVAWGILSDTCPELTNDRELGEYWARKGRKVTPLYATQPLAAVASPTPWKPLTDVQWMNIVNHERAYDDWSKDDAVHYAVKATEAKCREVNEGHAAVAVANAALPDLPPLPSDKMAATYSGEEMQAYARAALAAAGVREA